MPTPLTLTAAAAALRAGVVTSVRLTEDALAAADRLDGALGAYLARFDESALARAEQADRELAVGTDRGPLHGIAFGVKDVIATAEGPTTAQSTVLDPRWGAGRDATAVARLKAAGAVITGKLSTMEFACDVRPGAEVRRRPARLQPRPRRPAGPQRPRLRRRPRRHRRTRSRRPRLGGRPVHRARVRRHARRRAHWRRPRESLPRRRRPRPGARVRRGPPRPRGARRDPGRGLPAVLGRDDHRELRHDERRSPRLPSRRPRRPLGRLRPVHPPRARPRRPRHRRRLRAGAARPPRRPAGARPPLRRRRPHRHPDARHRRPALRRHHRRRRRHQRRRHAPVFTPYWDAVGNPATVDAAKDADPALRFRAGAPAG